MKQDNALTVNVFVPSELVTCSKHRGSSSAAFTPVCGHPAGKFALPASIFRGLNHLTIMQTAYLRLSSDRIAYRPGGSNQLKCGVFMHLFVTLFFCFKQYLRKSIGMSWLT
jgi:hypothetical protein